MQQNVASAAPCIQVVVVAITSLLLLQASSHMCFNYTLFMCYVVVIIIVLLLLLLYLCAIEKFATSIMPHSLAPLLVASKSNCKHFIAVCFVVIDICCTWLLLH